MAAQILEERLVQGVAWTRSIFPPLALVTVGSLLALVVLGLLIPLISLISNLSG